MSAAPKRLFTPEEYLAMERKAAYRSQYYRGEIYAMAGASQGHNRIARSMVAEIHFQLKNSPCEVFVADMRVKVDATGLYTYPDVVIVCDKPVFEDAELDTLLNPRAIVEVLSDSTEKYDRTPKFAQYRQIPSLQEYVLVSQDKMLVERYVCEEDGSWKYLDFSGPQAVFEFASVPVRITFTDIYRGVEFPPPSEADGQIR